MTSNGASDAVVNSNGDSQLKQQEKRTVRDRINDEKRTTHHALYNLLSQPGGIPPYHSIQASERDSDSSLQSVASHEHAVDRERDVTRATAERADGKQTTSAPLMHHKKKFLQRQKWQEERKDGDVTTDARASPAAASQHAVSVTNAIDRLIENKLNVAQKDDAQSVASQRAEVEKAGSGKSTPSSNSGGQSQSNLIEERIRHYLNHENGTAPEVAASGRAAVNSKGNMTIAEQIHLDIENHCRSNPFPSVESPLVPLEKSI